MSDPFARLDLPRGAQPDEVEARSRLLLEILADDAPFTHSLFGAEALVRLRAEVQAAREAALHELGRPPAAGPMEGYYDRLDRILRENLKTTRTEPSGQPATGTEQADRQTVPPKPDRPVVPEELRGRPVTGRLLRAVREANGIGLEEVEAHTKVSKRNIEAIEMHDPARLPARVYVRGFVMAYARFLGIEQEQAWRDYGLTMDGPGGRGT